MSARARRNPFFERLKEGLGDAIRFAKGEIELRTTVVPSPPPELRPRDIVALRKKLNLSQGLFAQALNVSIKTVRSWEAGSVRPERTALRLLQVIRAKPDLIGGVIECMPAAYRRST